MSSQLDFFNIYIYNIYIYDSAANSPSFFLLLARCTKSGCRLLLRHALTAKSKRGNLELISKGGLSKCPQCPPVWWRGWRRIRQDLEKLDGQRDWKIHRKTVKTLQVVSMTQLPTHLPSFCCWPDAPSQGAGCY